MIEVITAEAFQEAVPSEKLEQAALAVLAHEEIDIDVDLTIAVDDDARLQELNRQFLGIDAPTDVLSFPAGDDEIDPETQRVYLGDVIVSYPRALEQAEAAGHGVLNEIQLLVVHGVLHLLGYDHAEPDEKAAMWQVQGEVIQAIHVKINRLPE